MKRINLWPGMVFGLIGLNFTVVGITLYAASADRSFAVEPQYDRHALAWNDAAARTRDSRRLGWTAAVEAAPDAKSVCVRLTDRAGVTIAGAAVSAIAFHSARAAHRLDLTFKETAPGLYRADADLARPGFWVFRISATRAADRFTAAVEIPVVPPRRDRPEPPGDRPLRRRLPRQPPRQHALRRHVRRVPRLRRRRRRCTRRRPPRRRAALNAAYNGGRLVTYTALGAAAGLVGSAVDLGASAVGLQRAAAALAGALMVGFGLVAILRLRGVRLPHAPAPAFLRAALVRGHRTVSAWTPTARAAAIGLLTTFLPCGWLYAFVITAAGTAHPLTGAATMAAFWLGTLPVMAALGAGVQAMAGPLRRRLPLVTSLALVAVGLYTVAGRIALPALAPDPRSPDTAAAIRRVQSLDAERMPCCDGD